LVFSGGKHVCISCLAVATSQALLILPTWIQTVNTKIPLSGSVLLSFILEDLPVIYYFFSHFVCENHGVDDLVVDDGLIYFLDKIWNSFGVFYA